MMPLGRPIALRRFGSFALFTLLQLIRPHLLALQTPTLISDVSTPKTLYYLNCFLRQLSLYRAGLQQALVVVRITDTVGIQNFMDVVLLLLRPGKRILA
jgi:hypothetical protein